MADNIFAKSPTEIASEKVSARQRGVFDKMTTAPTSNVADFDTLARVSQVPQNIIEAAHEMSGLSGAEGMEFARGFSEAVGAQIAQGVSVDVAVAAMMPDAPEVAKSLLDNAVARVKPAPAAEELSFL